MPRILANCIQASALPLLVAGFLLSVALPAYAVPVTIQSRVGSSADDAEESASGAVNLSSSDLEMTVDKDNQVVGIRFNNLNIEQGAVISSAYVQFAVDETTSTAVTLQVAAEASDNAQAFSASAYNISARPRTGNSAAWTPAAWTVVGAAGAGERTPDLASILQEVVNRPGWQPGNSIAIIIAGPGTGKRVAQAWDVSPALAPLLHIQYESTANQPPNVSITNPANGTSVVAGTALTLSATAQDLEDGDISNNLVWSSSRDGALGTGAALTTTLSVGSHVITASVTDSGSLQTSATLNIFVSATGGSAQSLDRQVAASADDAEESATGSVNLTSVDLELVQDATTQTVGMRFTNINIPPGSVVTNAWIQFTAHQKSSTAANLVLRGQASANAGSFTTGALNVSGRPRTSAQVTWIPDAWPVAGASGPAQRTPDLSAIINEIIGQPTWASGNALAIIVNGSGKRNAKAVNSSPVTAPLLHIDYIDSGANAKPTVAAGPDATITLPVSTYNLNGTVTDDGRPGGSALTTTWSHVGGTGAGTVGFSDASAVDTTFNVTADTGTYVLRLTATDGDLTEYDDVTITVAPQSTAGEVISITQINYFDTGFVNLTSPLAIPATDPAGITYHAPSGHLIIADSEIDEISTAFSVVQANLFETPLAGGSTFNQWNTTLKTGNEPVTNREPTGIIYCEYDQHIYTSNDDARRLYRYAFNGSTLTAVDSFSTSGYSSDPEDITCDPATGRLYVIGGSQKNILVLRYQGGFILEQNIDLTATAGSAIGIPSDPEGIAFDPGSGHLFVTSSPDSAIFEFTLNGLFVKKLSISGLSPATHATQGIAVGPSSDNPQTTSFYLSDGLVDNDADPNERDGRIYEVRINRVQ